MPSIMHPSPAKAYTSKSKEGKFGLLYRAASQWLAKAMPTLVATPWPRGPVVVSTPDVQRYSGWPGHRLSSCRKFFRSSRERKLAQGFVFAIDRLHAGQVEKRIKQCRSVPGRKHESVAIGPNRIFGIKPQKLLPQADTPPAP